MSKALSKQEILSLFRSLLADKVDGVQSSQQSRQAKAKAVNKLVNDTKQQLVRKLVASSNGNQTAGLLIQYCYTVMSLEYRHKVWPYEYMAFSRRVGELWELFCSAAWEHANRPNLRRIAAPKFESVKQILRSRMLENIGEHANLRKIVSDVDILFDVVGEINMKEDEVFTLDEVPHVIDFKSGFGSNEKGNMLRLKTVGQAYKLWNPDTKLMLLVRQATNNNYLSVLERMNLWEVHTGTAAYNQVSAMTGADMQWVRDNVIDWQADLSPEFHGFLDSENILSYLEW